MTTQSNSLLSAEHLKDALKLFISALFLTIAGLLFWQGFHPVFDAIDAGTSVIRHAYQFMFMFIINIAGALMCLVYAAMPYFPALLKSMRNNGEHKSQPNVQPSVSPTNNIGSVGFIIASVSIVLGWVPAFGWLILLIGLVSCIIGVTRKPRWLAIIGLAITIIATTEVIFFAYILDYFHFVWVSICNLLLLIS